MDLTAPLETNVPRSATLRFAGMLVSTGTAFVSGVVVARHLGAAGKGTASLLHLAASTGGVAAAMGLGDAAITMVRRRGAAASHALTSSWLAAAGSAAGLLLLAAVAVDIDVAIVAAMVVVPIAALGRVASGVAQARGLVDVATLAGVIEGLVALMVTAVLVAVVGTGPAGVLVGLAAGWAAALALLVTRLWRDGTRPRPVADRAYVGAALHLGLPVAIASVLSIAAARLDLVVVAALTDRAAVGRYSVSITLGQLVVYGASALAMTSAPTIASLPDDAVLAYTLRVARAAVAVALVFAVATALATPFVVPVAFGEPFRGAIAPAVALAFGGVPVAAQVILCRARAVVGDPGTLVVSYATTIVVMIAADVALVPALGLVGAALASATGACAGLAVALTRLRRAYSGGFDLSDVVPRRSDWASVVPGGRHV